MRPTRPIDLVTAGVVAAVLAYLLVRLSYGGLPRLPLLAGITLLILAIAEVLFGNALRARIERRPGTEPVNPLLAARAVTVAKASSLGGAIMAGAWLGVLGYVLPMGSQVAAAAGDTGAAVVGLVSALALVGGALWLERCCRTPDDEDPSITTGHDEDSPPR
jgi:hypothetical protein